MLKTANSNPASILDLASARGVFRKVAASTESKERLNLSELLRFTQNTDILKSLILDKLETEYLNSARAIETVFDGMNEMMEQALRIVQEEIQGLRADLNEKLSQGSFVDLSKFDTKATYRIVEEGGKFVLVRCAEQQEKEEKEQQEEQKATPNVTAVESSILITKEELDKIVVDTGAAKTKDITADLVEPVKELTTIEIDMKNIQRRYESRHIISQEERRIAAIHRYLAINPQNARMSQYNVGVKDPFINNHVITPAKTRIWNNWSEFKADVNDYLEGKGYWSTVRIVFVGEQVPRVFNENIATVSKDK